MAEDTGVSTIRVATIDDSELICAIIETLLSKEDQVSVVKHLSCANDAMAYLAEHPVDVVTLDLNLPDARGPDLVSAIMSMDHCGVVVVSGSPNDHERALMLGASAAFDKAHLFDQRASFLDAIHQVAESVWLRRSKH